MADYQPLTVKGLNKNKKIKITNNSNNYLLALINQFYLITIFNLTNIYVYFKLITYCQNSCALLQTKIK